MTGQITGRPPKDSGYSPRKRVTFRLAPELVKAIKRGARRQGITQTAFVEAALQAWIKKD